MKSLIILSLSLLAGLTGIQAQRAHSFNNPDLKDMAIPAPKRVLESEAAPLNRLDRSGQRSKGIREENIGETRWDDQSNAALQNRLYIYPDGTVGATWIMGMTTASSYPDRGTGYNYFDGTGWQSDPTSRIEDERCGWPSYAPWGANGEMVVSHTSSSGLKICTRPQKGSGNWSQSLFSGPAGHEDILWPRMITSGVDNQKVHILALTPPSGYGGTPYMGLDGALVYSRSLDGGTSWTDNNIILPGMGSIEYRAFASDAYAFAAPLGDTLALVVGDNWHDLFLMKSTDGGVSWSKTVIFEHPYPFFDETTTLVSDTPWVCDGGMSVALDNAGVAHVVFGLMRVLNDDLTDGETSYFPFTDGIAHWKEGDAPFSSLNIDSVDARGDLVGYMVDWNDNDTIDLLPGSTEIIGLYYLAVSSMPSIAFDRGNNDLYLVFSSLMENIDNGLQHYRHILGRASADGGENWSPVFDMTSSIIHNFDECVYPTLSGFSRASEPSIMLIYQGDEEPGLSTWGDEDAPTDNTITVVEIDKITGLADQNVLRSVNAFPNPASSIIHLEIKLGKADNVELGVWDICGRKIFETQSSARQMIHTIDIDLSQEASGIYFYHISGDKVTHSGKLIKE